MRRNMLFAVFWKVWASCSKISRNVQLFFYKTNSGGFLEFWRVKRKRFDKKIPVFWNNFQICTKNIFFCSTD